MTGESDSIPRRRPPTIDLTATEIETERPAAEPGREEVRRMAALGRMSPRSARAGGLAVECNPTPSLVRPWVPW